MTPEALAKLQDLRRELDVLCDRATGMHRRMNGVSHDALTQQARYLADGLADLGKALSKLEGEMVSDTMRDADRNSKTVLDAALAGVALAERKAVPKKKK